MTESNEQLLALANKLSRVIAIIPNEKAKIALHKLMEKHLFDDAEWTEVKLDL